MAKKKKYIAEKTCAGEMSFVPGDEVELNESDAKPYVDAGALRPADVSKPEKAAAEKKAADEKAAAEKKAADDKKAAEEKAAAEKKAAEKK